MAARAYKTSTVTRITGFQPGVLRAWERRYSLLEPERSEGGHRLYTDDDLRVLLYVRSQIASGRAIGAIAREGRDTILAAAPPAPPLQEMDPSVFVSSTVTAGPWKPRKSFEGELAAARDALVQAAVDIDPDGVHRSIEEAFTLVDADRAVDEVLAPAARRIGELWAEGKCSVAGEHLVSAAIHERVHRLITHALVRVPRHAPEVLVACFPGDYHELPGLMVARELARGGFRTVWLGGALPFSDLEVAVRKREPKAVVLSVTLSHLYGENRLALREMLHRKGLLVVVVGGRGTPESDPELEEMGLHLAPDEIVPLMRSLIHTLRTK